jgi:signal transduction histidine kinase
LLDRSVLLSRHKLELADIAVNLDVPDTLPPVRGDFNQLQQCIINLIFNAADAMQQGGILTLTARLEEKNRQAVIEVSDTGVGIPTENLPRVFEPFFTSKAEGFGVGLGLSTVYGIVERHNGSVDVNSIEGEGTTFRIRLPLVE